MKKRKCDSIRMGQYCRFMGRAGCTYNPCGCRPIDEKCVGCDNVMGYIGELFCKSYVNPTARWGAINCGTATHLEGEKGVTGTKLNPIKASKRGGES